MAETEDTGELSSLDKVGQFSRFKAWFRKDREHTAEWRRDAREDYDFVAGEQWSEQDKAELKKKLRPAIVFNRTATVINAVSGMEISNRQEVRYIPREQGDVKPNELLTSAGEWFRDGCDAEDEESDAFMDAAICGYGWTETRLAMDEDPEGTAAVDRIDPIEMYYDHAARRRNLTDARRVWRVRRIPITEAMAMFEDADREKLDARWARDSGMEAKPVDADAINRYGENGDEADQSEKNDDLVTIVQVQWSEREPIWQIADPATNQTADLSEADYKKLSKRLKSMGIQLQAVKRQKSVYRQAFIGSEVIEVGPAPCKEHFSFACITGYRDRNKGTFYGLVRSMKDPQRWANKWLVQTLHIMNSSAKGGIIAEKGVAEDPRKFEESWAKNDEITTVANGVLSGPGGPRIQPKPVAQFPAGFFQLMEFAISSIRDVPGVSLELLGTREADQPASLEYQRRQSGMTILALFFDSLRRYRKLQGRVMLYIIQNYLSDGRLIRIVGEEGAQYVPLMKQADAKYDIIVDDSPTSPNQKEAIWAMIQPLLPTLPPQVQLALLEYSPFPTTVIEKVKKAAEEASKQQGEAAQKMMELEAGEKTAGIQKTEAETEKIKSEIGQNDPRIQLALDGQKMQGEMQIKREGMMLDHQLEKDKAGLQLGLEAQKTQAQMGIAASKSAADTQIKAKAAASKPVPGRAGQPAAAAPAPAPTPPAPPPIDLTPLQRGMEAMAKAMVEGQQQQAQAFTALAEAINAPKRLVRNDSGQAVGVETVQ